VDYLRFVAGALEAGRTANGVFAARIMWGTMQVLVDGLADERGGRTDLEVLGDALGPLCFVHLQRQDVVEQAVSWARAEQSGYWQQGDARCAEPRFDLDQIEKLVRTIREHNAAWRAWFIDQGVEVLAVTYESMAANPSDTVRCIVEAIGASLPTGWSAASPHKKQADAINEDWVKRYKDEAAVQPHQ
jgi:LPS sulfotransferase NodH